VILTAAQIADLSRTGDPIRTFLDVYTFCASRYTEIHNLLRTSEDEYSEQASESRRVLAIGEAPALKWADERQSMISGIALITSLSQHIASQPALRLLAQSKPYRTSDSFDAKPYWLAPNRPSPLTAAIGRLPRTRSQLHSSLQRYHQPLLVTPGELDEWTLTRKPANPDLENWLNLRLKGGEFRVAVSPLTRGAEIQGLSRPRSAPQPPHEFHLTSIGPASAQIAALQSVLTLACERRVAILVLPELRMPPYLLDAAREFLIRQAVTDRQGLLLVAAGSWHIDESEQRFNRCMVIDRRGEDVWTHDKLVEFEITARNVADSPDAYSAIGIGPGGGIEGISRGRELQFYDSGIGRLAVAICVGFFSPDVRRLIETSGVGLFLVPAMTPSITAIEECSAALVHNQHAFTLAANCGRIGPQAPSFCRWPASRDNIRRLDGDKILLTLDLNNPSMYAID